MSVILVSFLMLSLAAVALSTDCSQPIPSGGPKPQDLAAFIEPLLPQVCQKVPFGGKLERGELGYLFTITSDASTQGNSADCQAAFQDIVDQCITQGQGCEGGTNHCFGGDSATAGFTFNITNVNNDGTSPASGKSAPSNPLSGSLTTVERPTTTVSSQITAGEASTSSLPVAGGQSSSTPEAGGEGGVTIAPVFGPLTTIIAGVTVRVLLCVCLSSI